MANNYLMFSEAIDHITDEEKQWIEDIPEGIEYCDNPDYEDDEEWVNAMLDKMTVLGIDHEQVVDMLELFPYFKFNLQESPKRGRFWWLTTDESADLAHVACVVQAFIRKFRPDYIFKLTWCEYCDKPRIGEFGGGWVVVSKNDVEYGNTYSAADEVVEAMRTGSFKT